MAKRSHVKPHHVYLGAGSLLAIAALVVALTFGLSSAQSSSDCVAPMYWNGTSCIAPIVPAETAPAPQPNTPPPGGCPAPTTYWNGTSCIAPIVEAPTLPPPPTMPTAGCGTNMWWNGTSCVPTLNSTNPQPTQPPASGCGANMYWNGTSCVPSATIAQPPVGGCGTGLYWNGNICVPNSSATVPTTCGVNMYWNGTSCVMNPAGSTSNNTLYNCPSLGNTMVTAEACANATPVCAAGQMPTAASPCRTTSMTNPPAGGCGTNMYWNGTSCVMTGRTPNITIGSECRSQNSQATCSAVSGCNWYLGYNGNNYCDSAGSEAPSGSEPRILCRDGSYRRTVGECPTGPATTTDTSEPRILCNDGQYRRTVGECPTGPAREQTQQTQFSCPSLGGRMATPEACAAATPVCAAGQMPTMTNPCRPEGMQNYRSTAETQPRVDYYQAGQCPVEMQQCPDQYNPSNMVCMPKRIYWDNQTNRNIEGGRDATCADFNTRPMTNNNFSGRPTPTPYTQGPTAVNPCELNPYDPFCQAGFNFTDIKRAYEFNENDFDAQKFQVRNARQEVRNIKAESKGWARDAKQVRRQLLEVSRESSGFACPTALEVDALAAELEKASATVDALSESASQEEVATVLALREHINGNSGVRSLLFGGPVDQNGLATFGKIQSLNVCREISSAIVGACQAVKHVENEYNELKNGKAPKDVVAAFEKILPQLKERCQNPLGALQTAGVSFEEIAQPWYPDPAACGFRSRFAQQTQMSDQCMPPVYRYLGVQDLMMNLEEARHKGYEHFETMNACEMFEMGQKEFDRQNARTSGRGSNIPAAVGPLLKKGIEACAAGNTDAVEAIREEMFRIGRQGNSRESAFGDIVDVDQLVEDKLYEHVEDFEDEEDADEDEIAELKAQLNELTSKLDDAQKTIFALNEKLADMATKVASAVTLSDEASAVIGKYAQLPNKEVQQTVATTVSQLAEKVGDLDNLPTLPKEAQDLIAKTFEQLLASPPAGTTVINDIKESFNAIESYATSGASKTEILAKVKAELAEVEKLNVSDIDNKVTQGVCATKDTCDYNAWYATAALQGKSEGFIDANATEFKPAEPETKCAAVTRVARILEKAGEVEIDLNDKAPVAGAPVWCVPFIHALEDAGVSYAANLTNPNAPIDRVDAAQLLFQALKPEVPADYATLLPADARSLPTAAQQAIAAMIDAGIMGTQGSTGNFDPYGDLNRAQHAVITINAYNTVADGQ